LEKTDHHLVSHSGCEGRGKHAAHKGKSLSCEKGVGEPKMIEPTLGIGLKEK